MTDEKDTNLEWLVAASENFQSAVLEDNLVLARDIIADVRSHGFDKEAATLEAELINVQNPHE